MEKDFSQEEFYQQAEDAEATAVDTLLDTSLSWARRRTISLYAKAQLPVASLDQRTFLDLVDECVAYIPQYCPEWTSLKSFDLDTFGSDLYTITGSISKSNRLKLESILNALKSLSTDNVTVVMDAPEGTGVTTGIEFSSPDERSLINKNFFQGNTDRDNRLAAFSGTESMSLITSHIPGDGAGDDENLRDWESCDDLVAILRSDFAGIENKKLSGAVEASGDNSFESRTTEHQDKSEKLGFHISQSLKELGEVVDSL